MYRQGLGDCHLVTVLDDGRPVFRMLIDCGVYLTAKGGADLMRRIVRDVATETGGKIDVLAVTHEHWDHVSGLLHARDSFAGPGAAERSDGLQVGEVWMAWTEDPADPVARSIVSGRRGAITRVSALRDAAQRLAAVGSSTAADLGAKLSALLGFFGATGGTAADALGVARSLVERPRYCRPTDAPVTIAGGVRTFVLGPPLDPTLLFRLHDEAETYGMAASSLERALADAAEGCRSGIAASEVNQPFAAGHRRAAPFLQSTSGDAGVPPTDRFFESGYAGPDEEGKDQSWRRIDGDWLGASREFAIKLDNATNNTSLVLAFEMPCGRTLIFAADAQVGSWLSWTDLAWTVGDRTVTARDLLSRAAFLKVSHHGSHNGTLAAKGLELMPDGLVAFIPTDEGLAQKVGWGRMPLPALVDGLGRKTAGRVVRSDRPFAVAPGASDEVGRFAAELRQTELYYEVDIG